ncbi:maleylpyruvate isomerase N-terminal domain-containing protein [Actinokineospora soli]|uniref:Maleylpyruvate isomerase N-terminal domain-containing protein n=1 Tax=Actinokineospora soli TaxID=1048753 RepID=A0ABW2TKY7_9PSEU
MDIRDLDRRAIESTGAVIDELTEDQLDLPTPCAKWVVRDVIAHMVGNNHGLVTKLTGEERQPTDDVRRDYRTSAAALSTALASDDALAHKFDFPCWAARSTPKRCSRSTSTTSSCTAGTSPAPSAPTSPSTRTWSTSP